MADSGKNHDLLTKVARTAGETLALGRKFDLSPLTPGKSGALVFRIDIRGSVDKLQGEPSPIPHGNYVLKVYEISPDDRPDEETRRITTAIGFNKSFAEKHIPKIIKSYVHEEGSRKTQIIVSDIAGHSFKNYTNAAAYQSDFLAYRINDIVSETLDCWSNDDIELDNINIQSLFKDWLGYRIDDNQETNLQNFVYEIFRKENLAIFAGEALVNPLNIIRQSDSISLEDCPILKGFLHRDLHGDNILMNSVNIKRPYYIIDFAHSKNRIHWLRSSILRGCPNYL